MKKYIKLMAVIFAITSLCSCSDELLYESYQEVTEATEALTEFDMSFLEDFMDNYANGKYDIGMVSDDEAADKQIDDILNELDNEGSEEASESSTENTTEATEKETEAPTEKNTEKPTEKVTEKNESPKPKPNNELTKCIDVPFRSQSDMPTGCELVSTTMLLNYYGFDIEPYSLIEDGYIRTAEFEEKDGVLYGGDPNKRYIGDPRTKSGYGCYSGAIYDGLERFFEDEFFDVYDLNGLSMNDLCKQYIDFKQPVLIWVSIGMGDIYYDDKSEWTIKDTGKKFTWLSNEHCVVLVGYDDDYYYIHDPLKNAYTAYKRELVDKRYEEMGRQAISVVEW